MKQKYTHHKNLLKLIILSTWLMIGSCTRETIELPSPSFDKIFGKWEEYQANGVWTTFLGTKVYPRTFKFKENGKLVAHQKHVARSQYIYELRDSSECPGGIIVDIKGNSWQTEKWHIDNRCIRFIHNDTFSVSFQSNPRNGTLFFRVK